MGQPLADGNWVQQHVVIFYPERTRANDQVRLIELDPTILAVARDREAKPNVRLNARRAILMVIGRAFQVNPTRVLWSQLCFIGPDQLPPREVD